MQTFRTFRKPGGGKTSRKYANVIHVRSLMQIIDMAVCFLTVHMGRASFFEKIYYGNRNWNLKRKYQGVRGPLGKNNTKDSYNKGWR